MTQQSGILPSLPQHHQFHVTVPGSFAKTPENPKQAAKLHHRHFHQAVLDGKTNENQMKSDALPVCRANYDERCAPATPAFYTEKWGWKLRVPRQPSIIIISYLSDGSPLAPRTTGDAGRCCGGELLFYWCLSPNRNDLVSITSEKVGKECIERQGVDG
ncbi:hypothetical protein JTB14_032989 [Gonioctena quinquepunctata]|nr:hypothetical protein JTB14_032989 [Gonioctena quinquepunctata]